MTYAILEAQEIVNIQLPSVQILALGNKQHAMPPGGLKERPTWRGKAPDK